MERFALHGKFTARPGKKDELVDQLLEAARLMEAATGCELYAVSTSPADENAVWVTEIWRTEADHDASLSIAGVGELIRRTRALIAGASESTRLVVHGGKGIST
jgi:quinol monooxygenase YgiN